MSIFEIIVIIVLLLLSFYLYIERKRNRILGAFITGIVWKLSDVMCAVERIPPDDKEVDRMDAYKLILKDVVYMLQEDLWIKPYSKWLKRGSGLFAHDDSAMGGFPKIYSDLYELAQKEDREKE